MQFGGGLPLSRRGSGSAEVRRPIWEAGVCLRGCPWRVGHGEPPARVRPVPRPPLPRKHRAPSAFKLHLNPAGPKPPPRGGWVCVGGEMWVSSPPPPAEAASRAGGAGGTPRPLGGAKAKAESARLWPRGPACPCLPLPCLSLPLPAPALPAPACPQPCPSARRRGWGPPVQAPLSASAASSKIYG